MNADMEVAPLNTLFVLSKRPDGPFPDHISLGRARTNDVSINFPRVSKLHAILTWNAERTVFNLTDMETTNGTTIDNVRLKAQVTARPFRWRQGGSGPVPLCVSFARVLVHFIAHLRLSNSHQGAPHRDK